MTSATLPATLLDWSQVRSSVEAARSSLGLTTAREAFSYFAISKIIKIDDDEVRASITDGGNDRGIDAVYIDSRPESRVIHLFQFKFIDKFEKRKDTFPSSEIDKILTFLDDVLQKNERIESNCNPLLYQKVEAIWEALEEGVFTISIHLCSNASQLVSTQRKRLEESLRPYKLANVKEHDLIWFSHHLSRSQSEDRTYTIALVEDQYFSRADGFANGLIGTVRAEEILNFISDPEFPNEVDDTLFEENIRVYLGEQNDVNRKIFTSAISKENSKFWYLNNGITIVCERLSYQPRSSNPRAELLNPQIVNGGQTSHAIFEAARGGRNKVLDVKILIRIIETKDKNFTHEVAEATNSQTPIRSRDIRSNDSIQIKLENSLRPLGYYYERKNDQYVDQRTENRIDAVKLGQIILVV
ncbi:MAG: AIPR family protein [Sphingosinicella sp.]|nr:AIPR family protein [Sphingosinicella sp.]